jgi:hypothetical protein
MEGKSSFPCSHESTPLVRFLSQTTPVYALPPYFIYASFNIIIPPTPRSYNLSLSLSLLQASPLKFCVHFYSPPHAPPISPTCFYHSNHIWRGVHIHAFLKMQLSATSPFFLPPWIHVSSSALCSRTRSAYVILRERPNSAPIQNDRQNYSTVHFNRFVLRWQMGRQNDSGKYFS